MTPATAPTPAYTFNLCFSASLKNVWVSGADGSASDSKGWVASASKVGCVSECKGGCVSASKVDGVSVCKGSDVSESKGSRVFEWKGGASESKSDDEDTLSITRKSLCHRYEESNSSSSSSCSCGVPEVDSGLS